MRFSKSRFSLYFLFGLSICAGLLITMQMMTHPGTPFRFIGPHLDPIIIGEKTVGLTTRYIGAVEGNIAFNSTDLSDLGINTYRIYGGMSRWEATDDDEVYGLPSIADIKNNPNLINWAFWDQVMTDPTYGSDYSWSGKEGEVWQGSAATIFGTLKAMNIRPVLTLRNTDNANNPTWASQLNPPSTEADWNEWWEHVFATVYWLNVRNDFHVDEFEIHNEPDNAKQGWSGSVEDYFELVRISKDAIDFVYKTYLPNRQYSIHSPSSLEQSRWPLKALDNVPDFFDSINIHNYNNNISSYVAKVRGWATKTQSHLHSPIWLGEWGSYTNEYDHYPFALNLITNMIRGSQPLSSHVFGSHIFSLYDWGNNGEHQGLIGPESKRRLSYYAFRLGIRALQGGKAVMELQHPGYPIAIATQSDDDHLFLLLINQQKKTRSVTVDVSAQLQHGQAQQREFSHQSLDEPVGSTPIKQGRMKVTTPSQSATLLDITADPK